MHPEISQNFEHRNGTSKSETETGPETVSYVYDFPGAQVPALHTKPKVSGGGSGGADHWQPDKV